MSYNIVIIGGGPGGYVAAIRAAQMGAKVAVVEKTEVGGTCLNRGCIPTKAMVAGVEALANIRQAGQFGINVGDVTIDFSQLMSRKNEVVGKLVSGIRFLFNKHKIDLINGTAKIIAPGRVEVLNADGSNDTLLCANIIIATGSEPALISALGYDGEKVITSNEALQLTEVPASLLVIGGGVIGCEFACIFAELGSQVTVVDVMPTILPMVDKEAARQMQSLMKRRGINVKTKVKIAEVKKVNGQVTAVLESGEEIVSDKILISIGRVLNSKNIGLEEVGVAIGERGEILVDEKLATNVPGIYAIGDVTNKIQLAHVASAQGIVAVENIMGHDSIINYDVVPSCIFTLPEVASVGITTQQADEKGITLKSGKFPFMASGKAQAMGETDGFVKVLADANNDKILGVHIVGPHATDLIAEAAVAMQAGMTVEQLVKTIHAHPTLAEAMMEAAEAVHGQCIHA